METYQANSIRDFLNRCCDQSGEQNILSVLELDPSKQEYFVNSVSGHALKALAYDASDRQRISGISRSARLVMLGESSIDWVANFFAGALNGATVCPLDIKLTLTELSLLVNHFGATHLLVSDTQSERLTELDAVKSHRIKLIKFSELKLLPEALVRGLSTHPPETGPDPDLVLYTSGTSDKPKGVIVALSSIYFQAASIKENFFPLNPSRRVGFSLLPLNHVYGLSVGLCCGIWAGYEICLSQSLEPQNIQRLLRERSVNTFVTIPLFLSLIKNGIETKVRLRPRIKQIVFYAALRLNKILKSKWIARTAFKPIREGFGRDLDFFISGGASIENETIQFFEALGWPVYNGYGLTETGPVIASNSPSFSQSGSVGRILPGVEVKIEGGEICTRGPHVFKGYLNADDLTREAFDEGGWFRTGDLGALSTDGALSIQGRSKSMIVLSSGKKIQPEEIEDRLMSTPYVKFACLAAARRKGLGEKIIAVVQLHDAHADALSNQPKREHIIEELKKLCLEVADFKRPQEFIIRTEPFEVTSSQKVKRHVVQKELEAL